MTNWLTIKTFTFPTEAHVVKGYLESNGMDVFLKDEMTVQVNNFYSMPPTIFGLITNNFKNQDLTT